MLFTLLLFGFVAWQCMLPLPNETNVITGEVIQKSDFSLTVFDGVNRYSLATTSLDLHLYHKYQFTVHSCTHITSTHNDHLFSYENYAKSIRLVWRCKIANAIPVSKKTAMNYISNYLNQYSSRTRAYIEDMMLGLNTNQIKESVEPLSITYLIVISGMHFSLLEKMIERLFGFLPP